MCNIVLGLHCEQQTLKIKQFLKPVHVTSLLSTYLEALPSKHNLRCLYKFDPRRNIARQLNKSILIAGSPGLFGMKKTRFVSHTAQGFPVCLVQVSSFVLFCFVLLCCVLFFVLFCFLLCFCFRFLFLFVVCFLFLFLCFVLICFVLFFIFFLFFVLFCFILFCFLVKQHHQKHCTRFTRVRKIQEMYAQRHRAMFNFISFEVSILTDKSSIFS